MDFKVKASLLVGAIVITALAGSTQASAQTVKINSNEAAKPSAQMTADSQKNATVSPAAKNGWEKRGSDWYYYKNGVAQTGWLSWGGKWYYLNGHTGQMVANSIVGFPDGKMYGFGSDGAMQVGWWRAIGEWFYSNSSGVIHTGWLQWQGKWYYLNINMKTGWLKLGTTWYYLQPNDGAMVTGWQYIDGSWSFFSKSGAWLGYGKDLYLA